MSTSIKGSSQDVGVPTDAPADEAKKPSSASPQSAGTTVVGNGLQASFTNSGTLFLEEESHTADAGQLNSGKTRAFLIGAAAALPLSAALVFVGLYTGLVGTFTGIAGLAMGLLGGGLTGMLRH